ncbi:unnamed protein product [Lupinus luteus]|uniref:Uncharacterized protein n=1 Tax=Lupinus luteus TaxID=3873 RepID=A0AAV1X555_LUPLU
MLQFSMQDPLVRPVGELGPKALQELLSEIPLWVKTPDYERVDWLNNFLLDMWPFLDKAICGMIRITAKPILAEYIGKYQIKGIEFDKLSLGTLPPTICGIKVLETNEKELVMEKVIKWAGNPNIVLDLHVSSLKFLVQLVDLQVFATLRTTLTPLMPEFPCFSKIVISLMEKPHVDFGMKISGGDIMAIPGLYTFVQETIQKQVLGQYLWPKILEIPILDDSTKNYTVASCNFRAHKLLKKDLFGASDPYVKLNLTGDNLAAEKTTIKKRNLNPEWNEKFNLVVKDPQSQALQLQVYDRDKVFLIFQLLVSILAEKVGMHDRLGMQLIPLKDLKPYENKECTLDLLKDTNTNETLNKNRGQIVVDLTFVPFKEDSMKFDEPSERYNRKESGSDVVSDDEIQKGAGLLSVVILEAEEVEGDHHNNPYAVLIFRGEKKKTKIMWKTRDPCWNEEFQFVLEEPPLHEKIHIKILSKRKNFSFPSKESLGYVEINLNDVVNNGCINDKYDLINSKNGTIHVEIQWTPA